MDYNELKRAIKRSDFTFRKVAESTGMSEVGLRQSMDRGTMSIVVLEKISELLGVSPATFFDESSPVTIQVNNNRVGNSNNIAIMSSPEVKAMKQRIKDLEELVKSKDETLASLRMQIDLLNRYK